MPQLIWELLAVDMTSSCSSTCSSMRMKLHAQVAKNCRGMEVGEWFGNTQHEGILLPFVPLGEVAEVVRLIDESVWTIHEVVCRAIIPSTVSEPEGDSVLFCGDKTVLSPLDVVITNICRQVIQVDGASSVLGLITTNSFCWC